MALDHTHERHSPRRSMTTTEDQSRHMNTLDLASLETAIEAAFDNREHVNTSTRGSVRDAGEAALDLLDAGKVRVAQRGEDGQWIVNQWLKKAVLLSFRLRPMELVKGGPGQ